MQPLFPHILLGKIAATGVIRAHTALQQSSRSGRRGALVVGIATANCQVPGLNPPEDMGTLCDSAHMGLDVTVGADFVDNEKNYAVIWRVPHPGLKVANRGHLVPIRAKWQ